MDQTLGNDFDEAMNEESESRGNIDAFNALTVGPRDWTVHTIVDQILRGNIDLDPSFQRRSAWNDQKRSRFVESLILGVPIPQIVLAEEPAERGKFLVIDGKQRLLTLAGLGLPKYNFWDRARFSDLNTLTSLNGITLEDFLAQEKFEYERRLFGNAPIRCVVLSGTKDRDVYYDIFFRLNSGAVPLSGQELRQVFFRGAFARYLFDITNSIGPVHDVLGLDQPDPRLFDIELVLRFFAICLSKTPYRGDLRAYLDLTMGELTKNWESERPKVEALYAELNTVLVRLASYLGPSQIGRRFTHGRHERRFNKAVFEVQTYYFRLVPEDVMRGVDAGIFLERFSALCEDADFRSSIEATTKSIARFRTRFTKFRELINSVYGLNLSEAPAIAE